MLKTEDEITSITNIDDYISSLTNDEIVSKLFAFSEVCQHKLTQMKSLFNEISKKEDTINKLTLPSPHTQVNVQQQQQHNTTTTTTTEQEIRKEHQHSMYELEKEYNTKLETAMNTLDECYRNDITHIINEHDIKVKQLHNEIHMLQSELEEMSNTKCCISKSEHDVKMKKIFDEHVGVINKYDKQIEQCEMNIIKKCKKNVNYNVDDDVELEWPNVNDDYDNEEKVKMKENKFVMQLNKIKDVNMKNGKIILLTRLRDKVKNDKKVVNDKMDNSEEEGNECEVEEDDDGECIKNAIRNENYQIRLENISSIKIKKQ